MSIKRNILSFVALAVFCALPAKNNRPVATGVSFSDVNIDLNQRSDSVTISFRVSARKNAVDQKSVVVITPVFGQDSLRRSVLTPIVVQGKKAVLLHQRKKYFGGDVLYPEGSLVLKPGETANYKISLPYETWMPGALLSMPGIYANCCMEHEALSSNILAKSNFTNDASHQQKNDHAGDYFFAENWHDYFPGSRNVIFDVNKSVVDIALSDNMQVLNEVITTIRQVRNRISGVIITGYASPEGSHEKNMQLAYARANAVGKYIRTKTGLPANSIHALNIGIDYKSLRKLVAAGNMPNKDKVLYIIDHVPVWDNLRKIGRKSELLKLDDGEAWSYMLKNYFPYLRAASIAIVYSE